MTTALHSNAFAVLEVTTRDNRRRIVEAAEDRSLSIDSALCAKARADLTSPRARITAEIGWLPGLSPSRTAAMVNAFDADVVAAMRGPSALPLARANLYAAGFELLSDAVPVDEWLRLVVGFAAVVDQIEPEAVLRAINEDRVVAGFPEVPSTDAIEQELALRLRLYCDVLKAAINRLPTDVLLSLMNDVVQLATSNGNEHAPRLIDALVDAYELETQSYLQQEADNITRLVAATKAAAKQEEKTVVGLIDTLEDVVLKWDRVAQPIQLVMKSRGLDHDLSARLGSAIRDLSLYLYNKHSLLEQTQRLTELMRAVFAELPLLSERIDEDLATLADLVDQRDKGKRENAEFEQSITYRADLGAVFKDVLAISPKGIEWKGRTFPLDAVSRVRWGATMHSVNGVPTGTTYTIFFGDETNSGRVETKKVAVFDAFQDRLCKAVVVRLYIAMLNGLKEGRKYRFADLVIDDKGAEMTRHKRFGANERVYADWGKVKVWSGNGYFHVGLSADKGVYSTLSYLETDNTHIVEAAIRTMFKNRHAKLSDLLS